MYFFSKAVKQKVLKLIISNGSKQAKSKFYNIRKNKI